MHIEVKKVTEEFDLETNQECKKIEMRIDRDLIEDKTIPPDAKNDFYPIHIHRDTMLQM